MTKLIVCSLFSVLVLPSTTAPTSEEFSPDYVRVTISGQVTSQRKSDTTAFDVVDGQDRIVIDLVNSLAFGIGPNTSVSFQWVVHLGRAGRVTVQMFDSNEFESEFLAGVGRDSRGLEDMATCVATSQQDVTYSLQCVASDQERWVRKAGEPFFEVVMTVSTFRKSSVEQFLKQHRNRAIVVQVGPAEMPMGTTRDSASKTTTSTWERIKAGMSHVEAERTREWQDGTWADSTTMTTGAIAFPVFGGRAAVAVNATATSYAVATQQVVYFGVWRANTPIPMTVNAPVRYAVEDDRLYVIGEDGKKYSLKLTKKVLRPGDR